jgi:hypothetical protein
MVTLICNRSVNNFGRVRTVGKVIRTVGKVMRKCW